MTDTPDTAEVEAIARKLSETQREAVRLLTEAPETMLAAANRNGADATIPMLGLVTAAIERRDLIEMVSGNPHHFQLTPLGLAVRNHLLQDQDQ